MVNVLWVILGQHISTSLNYHYIHIKFYGHTVPALCLLPVEFIITFRSLEFDFNLFSLLCRAELPTALTLVSFLQAILSVRVLF